MFKYIALGILIFLFAAYSAVEIYVDIRNESRLAWQNILIALAVFSPFFALTIFSIVR